MRDGNAYRLCVLATLIAIAVGIGLAWGELRLMNRSLNDMVACTLRLTR